MTARLCHDLDAYARDVAKSVSRRMNFLATDLLSIALLVDDSRDR